MICKHCKQPIYEYSLNVWLHSFNDQEQCNVNYVNLPKAEPKEKPAPRPQAVLGREFEFNKRGEIVKKEKVSEYRFKVNNEIEIDVEKIARENHNSEMIVVIPKESKKAIIMVERDFHIKHGFLDCDDLRSNHVIVGYGFVSQYVDKEKISFAIDRYQKIKAQKTKQEVVVKCFGGNERFPTEYKEDVCKNCGLKIYKAGGKWFHYSNAHHYCMDNNKAEPDTLPFEVNPLV